MSQSTSLAAHAVGLIVLYSLYGVLQEKIMKGHYGPNEEKFTSASILVLSNRLFSMCVGLAIVLIKSFRGSSSSEPKTFYDRIKPASPVYAYAAVAVLNFLATFCQYEALKYVGFTTQALAKTMKMVPVLIIGTLVYKKQHKPKQWIAAMVVLAGCALYLTSRPDSHALAHAPEHSVWDGICGALLLIAYLGLDGFTSTTQEKVFGKNPNPGSPFGDGSPVVDQMVWVNLSASIISVIGALIAFPETMHSISLIVVTPALWIDILLLSATAALGLIVLLNTIAAFGALTSSTIMTVRQFLSILLNAGLFGHIGDVGIQGWLGVMYVAAGIWIKMDRRFEQKKPQKSTPRKSQDIFLGESKTPERDSLLADMSPIDPRSPNMEEDIEKHLPDPPESAPRRTPASYLNQYGPPLIAPILLSFIFAFLFPLFLKSSDPLNSEISTTASDITQMNKDAALAGDDDYQDEGEVEESIPTSAPVQIEAGVWGNQLHQLIAPECVHDVTNTTFYPDPIPMTALATYPRSGNSYIRSLVERSSLFRTSSVYCDRGLAATFLGECTRDPFLRKTHYPVNKVRASNINDAKHWTQFERQVHLVRNPIDAIYSYYQFRRSRSHTDRDEVVLGDSERESIMTLARRWTLHADYWERAPILRHQMRYEDLRANPLPNLMALLSFLLPADKLPSLDRLACVTEQNEAAEAYHSRKLDVFSAWDQYTPELRAEVLEATKEYWCRYGYDVMLQNKLGLKPLDCKTMIPGLRQRSLGLARRRKH